MKSRLSLMKNEINMRTDGRDKCRTEVSYNMVMKITGMNEDDMLKAYDSFQGVLEENGFEAYSEGTGKGLDQALEIMIDSYSDKKEVRDLYREWKASYEAK